VRQRSGIGRESGTGTRAPGAAPVPRGVRKSKASRSFGAAIRAGGARVADALWGVEAPVTPAEAADRRTQFAPFARGLLAPLGLYLLIAVAMSWPLALHLGTHLPGDDRDAWQNYWNYWWTRRALAEGRSLYWTPLLYAPCGA
jgi:hypothetical protein